MSTIQITELHVYPIKGCKGTSLQEARTDARGIIGDRSMMVVDAYSEFITQREMPRLALIAPEMRGEDVVLRAPGMSELAFTPSDRGRRVSARVWNDTCDVVDQGNDAALWLQDVLGAPVRLVRMADGFERKCDPKYARRNSDQTSFSDGYPFLLISQASLDELNSRLESPVPMNRFRPNIVVTGCVPFAEDEWTDIRAGDVDFGVVKPCARCSVPTIDQDTALGGREPIKTLATYRTRDQKVLFGQNLIAANTGTLRVGDAVTILRVRS